MKDAKGHGSEKRGAAAHQSGVEDATHALVGARKSDMNAFVARKVLEATGSHNQDYHTLGSSQQNALADYAKQFGYRKSATSPGSTGRAFHGYLHKQFGKMGLPSKMPWTVGS